MARYAIETVAALDRLPNSVSGNPRYRMHFEGSVHSRITSSDAGFCYGINNADMRNVPLLLTLTPAGRVAHARPYNADTDAVYLIVRMYQDDNRASRTIKRNLTLAQAQAHCKRDDTHGEGWFDGYNIM